MTSQTDEEFFEAYKRVEQIAPNSNLADRELVDRFVGRPEPGWRPPVAVEYPNIGDIFANLGAAKLAEDGNSWVRDTLIRLALSHVSRYGDLLDTLEADKEIYRVLTFRSDEHFDPEVPELEEAWENELEEDWSS